MRSVAVVWVVLVSVCVSGCGSSAPADADLPPGVRKNEQRNTGGAKKGKPTIIGGQRP